MVRAARCVLVLALPLLCLPLSLRATDTCKLSPLLHQRKDVATVLHLEDAWNVAYLRGDTELERCLLTADFTEVMRNGEVLGLAGELELAAKNRGNKLPIPDSPKIIVLLHGNAAVAYGKSILTDSGDKATTKVYADSYVWEHGAWHVFFAQQTQFENH